ncbi:hypothetical protein AAVH_05489 [Aphelenchoides avenae]|nr:hypothetical protein AAVH_05489 [Aphelenchus avenae]
MFLVLRDMSDDGLFSMPVRLFQPTDEDKQMLTKSQLLRRERVLEYGNNIFFTCNEATKTVLDYELSIPDIECSVENNLFLVSTVGVVSPDPTPRLWTKLFGIVPFDSPERAVRELEPASHDVAVQCLISVKVEERGDNQPARLRTRFYKFVEVVPDDRQVAWEAVWNTKKARPVAPELDEDEDYIAVEKDSEAQLGGIISGTKQMYCTQNSNLELQRNHIFIGLRGPEGAPVGSNVRFDAYYSDILDAYVVYFYEVIGYGLPSRAVGDGTTMALEVSLNLRDQIGGLFRHSWLGPISDSRNKLRLLPYAAGDEARNVRVYIADKRPKSIARFEIIALSDEARKLVQSVDQQMKDKLVKAEGVLLNKETQTVYAVQYPRANFYLKEEDCERFEPGALIRFTARYAPADNLFIIDTAEAVEGQPPLECYRQGDRYMFKRNLTMHNLLKVPHDDIFGLVNDPNQKLPHKPKASDLKSVLLEQDTSPTAQTAMIVHSVGLEHYSSASENVPTDAIGGLPAYSAVSSQSRSSAAPSYYHSDEDSYFENSYSESSSAAPKPRMGTEFCSTTAVKDRKRQKLRERNFKKRAEGKSVWDPRTGQYNPPKPPKDAQNEDAELSRRMQQMSVEPDW